MHSLTPNKAVWVSRSSVARSVKCFYFPRDATLERPHRLLNTSVRLRSMPAPPLAGTFGGFLIIRLNQILMFA
jgi:hypothetical protein